MQYTSSSNKTVNIAGSIPSVTYSDGLAILVFQGNSGELYSLGANNILAGITRSAPVKYTTGYNPSVSVYGCPTCPGWTVVEAHQSTANDQGEGPLMYRTATISKAGTIFDGGTNFPTLVWTPDVDTQYEEGCYPSVATNAIYVWETHASTCYDTIEAPDVIYSTFGLLVY